ncbi:sensor histidine kinase [Bacillus piscicola]|uniref:sensor histidine kinase n=1 Tax=Bacillus piscicola TaxID=1632684 RepID=UPI001F096038|nr:sensor histidine kinase [Bacillus piscicola]
MLQTHSVASLCQAYTTLSPQDIKEIEKVNETLQLTADLYKANVFIDCLIDEGKHAMVVAEASPATTESIYVEPVVGRKVYEAFEPAVFQTLHAGKAMFANRALNQEGIPVEQNVVPIKGGNGRVIGALIMEKDISERLKGQAELKALSRTAESLSNVLIGMTENRPIIPEIIEEALFFVKTDGSLLYFNPPAINLVSDLSGKKLHHGVQVVKYLPELNEMLHYSEELAVKEMQISGKTFQVKRISLPYNEKYVGLFLILQDITELREKEKQLIMKSVAIQEIHHRVKNNLQTVASLLRLQMRRGLPEESKVHFLDSLNRISSIASVYEVILANSSIDEVDIFTLSQKIGNMLVHDGTNPEGQILIHYVGEELTIESERAVSIALVINELIQNCLKHAFKDRQSGVIKVYFMKSEETITVEVRDNGVGYVPSGESSLGLDIVKMVSKHDLSGRFEMKRVEDGTIARVVFPFRKQGLDEK